MHLSGWAVNVGLDTFAYRFSRLTDCGKSDFIHWLYMCCSKYIFVASCIHLHVTTDLQVPAATELNYCHNRYKLHLKYWLFQKCLPSSCLWLLCNPPPLCFWHNLDGTDFYVLMTGQQVDGTLPHTEPSICCHLLPYCARYRVFQHNKARETNTQTASMASRAKTFKANARKR